MEALHFCEKCRKPILSSNEQIKDNKYYHKSCLNFAHESKRIKDIKSRYSPEYFGKTLMTEVVRPYYQLQFLFHYKIKKSNYLKLIPKIALYF